MGWRKFFNELLVVSPFLLVGAITVQARTRVESYEPPRYSASMHQKVAAYCEPVRLVEDAVARGFAYVNEHEIRQIGETWRNMGQDGSLQPLLPETPDDSTREGIKGQVRKAADNLASALQYIAKRQIKEGNAYGAAKDAILSIEAIQSFKYSDLYSVGMLSVRQNGAFDLLEAVSPTLTPAQKAEVQSRLLAIRNNEKPLADLVMAKQKVLLANNVPGGRSASTRQLDLMLQMANAIDGGSTTEALAPALEELRRSAKADDVNSFLPEFRFAFNARRNVSRSWIQVHQALNRPNA